MFKKIKLFLLCCIMLQFIVAQQDLTGQINTWKDNVKIILDAAVALFAIAGGFIVFMQYMQGNEQAQRNFIRFLIGLGIFGLIEAIASFFITTT